MLEPIASIRGRPRGELGIYAAHYLPLAATFILATIALALRGLNLCLSTPKPTKTTHPPT